MAQTSILGTTIRNQRRARHLSIEKLAELSGVSARTISDIERGHSRAPHQRTIDELAAALGLGPTDSASLADAAADRRLVTPDAPRSGQLPPETVRYVGRRSDLTSILAVLKDRELSPLVVVSGMGGLGKTTLAVRIGHLLSTSFELGACFVPLAGMADMPLRPEQAATRILRYLGRSDPEIPGPPEERLALLQSVLHDSDLLLILDNASDEAQVRPLLPARDARCAVVVTARSSLTGLPATARAPLMPLPERDSVDLLSTILGDDGIDASDLAELASCCGRYPLALTIAANQLQSRPGWNVRTMVDRLADQARRINRLRAGDLAIDSTFRLSYQQLDPTHQQLFRRLSLIDGPDWSVEAAAALTGRSVGDTDDELNDLVDLGLLQMTADFRFSWHDLVRLFAAQRLSEDESGADIEAAGAAYRKWILVTAAHAGRQFGPELPPLSISTDGPELRFDRPAAARAWLRAEGTNWLHAFRTESVRGNDDLILAVANAIHWFTDQTIYWGHWSEIFTRSRAAAVGVGDVALEAKHLNYLAWTMVHAEGQFADGLSLAQQALDLAVRAGDTAQQGWAHAWAASAWRKQGEHGRAVDESDQAGRLFLQAGELEGYMLTLVLPLIVADELGHDAEVMERAEHILEQLDAPDSKFSPTIARTTRVETHRRWAHSQARTGDTDGSEARFRTAIEIARTSNLILEEARTLREYVRIVLQPQGRTSDALAALERARERFLEANSTAEADAIAQQLDDLHP